MTTKLVLNSFKHNSYFLKSISQFKFSICSAISGVDSIVSLMILSKFLSYLSLFNAFERDSSITTSIFFSKRVSIILSENNIDLYSSTLLTTPILLTGSKSSLFIILIVF